MENRNVYKGNRYVPKIMGEWNQEEMYDGLSIVIYQGTSYTSKKRVPKGIEISNEEYWVITGNYNAQVENYRQEVKDHKQETTDLVEDFKQETTDLVEDFKQETTDLVEDFNENLTNELAKTIQYTHVDSFGAVGDGVTDDTIAIRTAISSVTEPSVLTFSPGKRYRITQSININAEKIRMVLGNNAYIMVDGDFEAIKYVGNKTFGSTGPNEPRMSNLSTKEMSTIIKDIQIYSVAINGEYKGVGISIENQHSPIFNNCHFFNLNVGLSFKGKNTRNIIIDNCHFWDNRLANIRFDNYGEVHQCLISNSHISYAKYGILIENYDMFNLHLSNVSMEAQLNQNDGFTSFIKSTGRLDEFFISNCNFQDHKVSTEWLLDIDGFKRVGINNSYISYSNAGGIKFVNGSQLIINSNIFDRLGNDAIYLEDVNDFTIDSNHFKEINGQVVRLRGNCQQLAIKGNVGYNVNGLLDVELPLITSGIIDSNNVRPSVAPAFHIKTTGNMRNLKVNNNIFYWYETNYSSTKWALKVECEGGMSACHFMNNSLSARSQGSETGFSGLKITAEGDVDATFIKNNTTDEIKTSAGRQAFDLPLEDSENGVVVAENMSGRPR